MNQDSLSETRCINRFSPEELCAATCVLVKSIVDNQQQQEKFPFVQSAIDITLIFSPTLLFSNRTTTFSPQPLLSFYDAFRTSDWLMDIFRPPWLVNS
ncbi:MAG: hypothetical protein AAF960_03205 [Bacteroidota bacterium]